MITLRIVTPQGFYKEMETSILNVVTTDGKIGILPSHMPVVAILEISNITTILEILRIGPDIIISCLCRGLPICIKNRLCDE